MSRVLAAPAPPPQAPPPLATDRRAPRRLPFRPALVARPRLVARLAAAADVPLVVVVAPAGYGKTTLLAEWEERDERPFARVPPHATSGDTADLLTSFAFALDAVDPVGPDVLTRGESLDLRARRLARSLSARRPFVLIVDDAQALDAPAASAAFEVLLDHLPPGAQLVLASRTEPAMPVARLRAHRRLFELRARDLVMTRAEAAELLGGLDLRAADIEMLVRRTEGWPAGLYLAALALLEQPDRRRALAAFAGDDRFVADYLREEFLAELPSEQLTFLTRTSVLQDLSGPVCDAVLARPGSGGTLRDLARSNLMLVPLDRADGRYRYHGLFAEMLRAELRRLEPEYEPEAHRRASEWHLDRGDVERAIHHATAAGDVANAGALLWRVAPGYAMDGRLTAIRRWLERFTRDQIATDAALALTAAIVAFASGDRARVEHWCVAAERRAGAPGPDGAVAGVATLRAFAAPNGLVAMSERAGEIEATDSGDVPWRALCRLMQGAAAHLTGDAAAARAHLEDGARRAAVGAPLVQVLCLAHLGVLAIDEDDDGTADVSLSRARRQVERVGLGADPLCALVLAASALDRAQRGRVDEARRDMRQASRLLASMADFTPWYDAQTRILLARAGLRLGDVVGGRTLLAEASRLAARVPDGRVLHAWLRESWARADSFSAAAIVGPTSLTTAELRVLRLLPTHLSFREIAVELHVSANTIKTQAHAVYRKLDASSRTEAVETARRLGLLDAP